jgi:DNA-binding transcriptional LysR family regulator
MHRERLTFLSRRQSDLLYPAIPLRYKADRVRYSRMAYGMRVDDIQMFVAIAKAGSLVRASQRVGVSQPTLSKSIARLERALKVQLVERYARGVRLTETGALFLSYAQNLNIDLQDALVAIRELRQGYAGTVRFGVGIGIPQGLVAAACQKVLDQRKLAVEMSVGMAHALFRSVVDGELEFAIFGVPPPQDPNVTWESLFADPLVPVAPRSHSLANARRMTWQMLAQQKWILASEDTMSRSWFDRQFRDRNLAPPSYIVVLRNSGLALELGSSLNAISLAPASLRPMAQKYFNHCALRTPSNWHSDRVVGVLHRTKGYKNPAARALMDSFKITARKMFRGMA